MCSGCLYSSRLSNVQLCQDVCIYYTFYVSAVRARTRLAEDDLNVSVGDIVLQVPFTCCKHFKNSDIRESRITCAKINYSGSIALYF